MSEVSKGTTRCATDTEYCSAGTWEAAYQAPANEAGILRSVEALDGDDLNALAEKLEAALRANSAALLEHFVKTATAVEVRQVAGGRWAEADNDQVSALREILQLRLALEGLGRP